MAEKYFMLDLNDSRAGAVADVLQNKTCKIILSHLAEKESSEGDLVNELKMPAATVHYGVKKLVDAGFITSSQSFWSVKGKKIPIYKVSEKKIVISPKSASGSGKILATLGLTGLAAVFLKLIYSNPTVEYGQDTIYDAVESAKTSLEGTLSPDQLIMSSQIPEVWLWFFLGGIFALMIYMILNWRRL
jgi:DNA-binding transcriptional ArsR family regulator